MKNQNPYHDESMWKGAPSNNFLLAKHTKYVYMRCQPECPAFLNST